MRKVVDTEPKPDKAFSAMGQTTEWTSTKTSEAWPSPNHMSATGSSAMAGSGLKIDVSMSSHSAATLVVAAAAASTIAGHADGKPLRQDA